MDKHPNIILLVMDSVRVDRLSCYGYHRNTTPHIDRISKDSTLYEEDLFTPYIKMQKPHLSV